MSEPIPIDPVTQRPIRGKGSRGARTSRPKELGGARLGFNQSGSGGGSGSGRGGRGSRGGRGAGTTRGKQPRGSRGRGSLAQAHAHLLGHHPAFSDDMKANNTNQSDNGNPNANANANDTPDSFGPSSLVLPVCTLLDIDCPPQLQLPIQSETADKTANDDGNKERDNDSLLNSDKDSDSDNDEDDDEEEGDKTIAIEPRSDRERAELQALIDSFDTDQMMRFETFRRSKLSKSAVKKLLTSILGTTTVPQNVLIAMAAIGKLFVGDITEIAREVMHEYDEDDMGGDTALAPHHVREAYRRWKVANRWLG